MQIAYWPCGHAICVLTHAYACMNITGLNDCSNKLEHCNSWYVTYLVETSADLFSAFCPVFLGDDTDISGNFPLNVSIIHHFVIINNQHPNIQVYTDSGHVFRWRVGSVHETRQEYMMMSFFIASCTL